MNKKTNKQIAIEAGLSYYETGKPCKRGHLAARRISTNDCIECSKLRQQAPAAKAYKSANYSDNKEKYLTAAKAGYEKNREAKIAYAIEYQRKNIQRISKRRQENFNEKVKELPWLVIKRRARSSCYLALKRVGSQKKFRTLKILGCTGKELQRHIERQFLDGMNWENRDLWHIDHIVPLASAKSEAEIFTLCHFTNLRPLWASDNIKKSDKMEFLL